MMMMMVERTLLDILRPRNPLANLLFVRHAAVGGKGFVEPGAKVVVSEWVFAAEVEEFWEIGLVRRTVGQKDDEGGRDW